MQKYEYKVLVLNTVNESPLRIKGSAKELEEDLNQLGRDGWEVTAFSGVGMNSNECLILKRSKYF